MSDIAFLNNPEALHWAVQAIDEYAEGHSPAALDVVLSENMPETGMGDRQALETLAPIVLGGACKLNSHTSMAHMDPPTPWTSWATSLWNASLNQNLLHPSLSPVASVAEQRVVQWMGDVFGTNGGHITPGSTVSNLTALWAARELAGIKRVVASTDAHISVAKSAHILGLQFEPVITNASGQIDKQALPALLQDAALVLTAGTTSCGAIDSLALQAGQAWTHVDAAWSGPLRFSNKFGGMLDGIEQADSIAVSAHKWLFQPKECALVLFKNAQQANKAISFGAEYLMQPNVGVLGSHGASGISLLAMLMAWGRTGVAQRIDHTMGMAAQLRAQLEQLPNVEINAASNSGVLLWRHRDISDANMLVNALPAGCASRTAFQGAQWVRHVAANPNADVELITAAIGAAIRTAIADNSSPAQ